MVTNRTLRRVLVFLASLLRTLAHGVERWTESAWSVVATGLTYRRQRLGGDVSWTWRDVVKADPCPFCGQPSDTIDHVIPKARRGQQTWRNEVGCCVACNAAKADTALLIFLVASRHIERARAKRLARSVPQPRRRRGMPLRVSIAEHVYIRRANV